ncbi:MAG: hypothetical protein GVY18_09005 [Bacteroidetes bacterium]|jgi:hypothetical protein|nr:hypothetical protein [Bacteroidota bacterium]
MSWISDLLGPLIQKATSDIGRRRVWNFQNGPDVTDNKASDRLDIDFSGVPVATHRVEDNNGNPLSVAYTALAATAATSKQYNLGAPLPANSFILGASIQLDAAFAASGASFIELDVGSSGDADAILSSVDIMSAPVDGQANSSSFFGVAPFKLFASSTQLLVTFRSDVNLDTTTAGDVTVHVFYSTLGS